MSVAVLKDSPPESIVSILNPAPPPLPPADWEAYYNLLDRYISGESLPVDEVKAIIARAYRTAEQFAADVVAPKDRRQCWQELATAEQPAVERREVAEKSVADATARLESERPKHEAAIRAAQQAIADLEQRQAAAQRTLAATIKAHDDRMEHCRRRMWVTVPRKLRERVAELKRQNERLQVERIDCARVDWAANEAGLRKELATCDEKVRQLDEKAKNPAPGIFPYLRNNAAGDLADAMRDRHEVDKRLRDFLASKPDPAALEVRQREIVEEYNGIVGQIFDPATRPDLADA